EPFKVEPQGRRQLAQQRPPLAAQRRDILKESRERLADVLHRAPMRDFLRNLDGKPETRRRGSGPSFEGRRLVTAIEGRVDLDAIEDRRIPRKAASFFGKSGGDGSRN